MASPSTAYCGSLGHLREIVPQVSRTGAATDLTESALNPWYGEPDPILEL